MWIHGNTFQLDSKDRGVKLVAAKVVVVVLVSHHDGSADQTMHRKPSYLDIVHSLVDSVQIDHRLNQYLV